MLDRTIPFFNTIIKCSDYKHRDPELPDGFSIISYQPAYEKEWAKLEVSIGDFCSSAEAEDYFIKTYLHDPNQSSNILFALNSNRQRLMAEATSLQLSGSATKAKPSPTFVTSKLADAASRGG